MDYAKIRKGSLMGLSQSCSTWSNPSMERGIYSESQSHRPSLTFSRNFLFVAYCPASVLGSGKMAFLGFGTSFISHLVGKSPKLSGRISIIPRSRNVSMPRRNHSTFLNPNSRPSGTVRTPEYTTSLRTSLISYGRAKCESIAKMFHDCHPTRFSWRTVRPSLQTL